MISHDKILNPRDYRIRLLHRSDLSITELSSWLKDLSLASDDYAFTGRINQIRSALIPIVNSLREEIKIQEEAETKETSKLDELPDSVRSVMRLSLIYDMPFYDISKKLNITINEVSDIYETGIDLMLGVNKETIEKLWETLYNEEESLTEELQQ